MTETELETILVRLTGDGSQYQQMLKKAEQSTIQAASVIKQNAQAIEKFQGSLTNFARTATGALAGLGLASTLQGAWQKFTQAEQGAIRLDAAIKANGKSIGATKMDYDEFAQQIAATTTTSVGMTKHMLQQAEIMGLTNQQAKDATTFAIALAGAKGGEASQYMRVGLAIEQGNFHMLRHILHLHNVKDNTELLAKAQKIMQSGLESQGKIAETTHGKLEQLSHSFSGMTKNIGEMVDTAIKPWVEKLKDTVDWFNALSPEVKAMTVKVVALALAIPLIGPALTAIKAAASAMFGPIISLLGVATSLFMSLLSPIGLVTAAIVGAGYVFLKHTDTGQKMFDSFTKGFKALAKDAKVGVDGVVNAIKAGNLELAFEIAWTQIQLTFAKATGDIQKKFITWIASLKVAWAVFKDAIKTGWEEASDKVIETKDFLDDAADKAHAELMVKMGKQTREAADKEIAEIDRVAAMRNKANADQALYRRQDQQKNFEKEINDILINKYGDVAELAKKVADLEAKRNELAKQASDEAGKRKVAVVPVIAKLPVIPNNGEVRHVKIVITAVAAGSAEAWRHIQEYRDTFADTAEQRAAKLAKKAEKGPLNLVQAMKVGGAVQDALAGLGGGLGLGGVSAALAGRGLDRDAKSKAAAIRKAKLEDIEERASERVDIGGRGLEPPEEQKEVVPVFQQRKEGEEIEPDYIKESRVKIADEKKRRSDSGESVVAGLMASAEKEREKQTDLLAQMLSALRVVANGFDSQKVGNADLNENGGQ